MSVLGNTTSSSSTVSAPAKSHSSMEKTSVWWDIENCQVPKACDPYAIAQNINSALVEMGYGGPVSISAYGDTNVIPHTVQQALSSTGVGLNHVPAGVKDASDKKILVDMLLWAVDNPAPANYLLISGDRDFSNALHQLRMRKYDILLAQPQKASAPLVAAANTVWLWTTLLSGGPPQENSEMNHIETTPSTINLDFISTKQQVDPASGVGYKPKRKTQKNQTQSNVIKTFSADSRHTPMGNGGPVSTNSSITDQKGMDNFQPSSRMTITRSLNNGSKECTTQPMISGPYVDFHAPLEKELVHANFNLLPSVPAAGFNPHSGFTQGRQFNEVPYGFLGENKMNPSTGLSSSFYPDLPNNNGNTFSNHHIQNPQPLKPSDLLPRPTFVTGNNGETNSYIRPYPSVSRSNEFPFNYSPTTSMPDINKLNISEDRNNVLHAPNFSQNPASDHTLLPVSPFPGNLNVCQNPTNVHPPFYRPPVNNLPHASDFSSSITQNMNNTIPTAGLNVLPGASSPSNALLSHIGSILLALHTLKEEKIVPTEVNITDCIIYGDVSLPNFNVRMALDSAVEQKMIVKHTVGDALQVYIQKNDTLWKCINPIEKNVNQSKAILDVKKFLSVGGRSAILTSQCRYHAATILKKSCLKHLALGEVLQVLHSVITVKKWIVPHWSGWQPLSITISETGSKVVSKTSF